MQIACSNTINWSSVIVNKKLFLNIFLEFSTCWFVSLQKRNVLICNKCFSHFSHLDTSLFQQTKMLRSFFLKKVPCFSSKQITFLFRAKIAQRITFSRKGSVIRSSIYALRVLPAETRLTVYRRRQVSRHARWQEKKLSKQRQFSFSFLNCHIFHNF